MSGGFVRDVSDLLVSIVGDLVSKNGNDRVRFMFYPGNLPSEFNYHGHVFPVKMRTIKLSDYGGVEVAIRREVSHDLKNLPPLCYIKMLYVYCFFRLEKFDGVETEYFLHYAKGAVPLSSLPQSEVRRKAGESTLEEKYFSLAARVSALERLQELSIEDES